MKLDDINNGILFRKRRHTIKPDTERNEGESISILETVAFICKVLKAVSTKFSCMSIRRSLTFVAGNRINVNGSNTRLLKPY